MSTAAIIAVFSIAWFFVGLLIGIAGTVIFFALDKDVVVSKVDNRVVDNRRSTEAREMYRRPQMPDDDFGDDDENS